MTRALLAAGAAALALVACSSKTDFDPRSQMGANPVLPEPQQYLIPPMHVAPVEKWKDTAAWSFTVHTPCWAC